MQSDSRILGALYGVVDKLAAQLSLQGALDFLKLAR